MKILHIVRALDIGGLERVVLDLVEGCKGHGIESHIACLHHAGTWGEGRDDLTVLSGMSKCSKAVSLARLAWHLKADVLHSHNPEPHVVAVLAGLLAGVPIVHTKHGRNYPRHWRRVWLNRFLARCSRKVVVVSSDAFKVARDIEKIPERKLVAIYNGIDSSRFEQKVKKEAKKRLRLELGLPENAFIVGSVGRLSPEKNYPMLVDAFAQLYASVRYIVEPFLVLVGEGPDRGRIEEEIEAVGIGDRISLVGARQDVDAWLKCMDVFCLSSTTEGTSMTLLEAGAAGLPAVVTDVGGNGEIVIDGESGFVVPTGDSHAFANVLAKLVREQGELKRLGLAALGVSDRYSMRSMLMQYCDVYGCAGGRGLNGRK